MTQADTRVDARIVVTGTSIQHGADEYALSGVSSVCVSAVPSQVPRADRTRIAGKLYFGSGVAGLLLCTVLIVIGSGQTRTVALAIGLVFAAEAALGGWLIAGRPGTTLGRHAAPAQVVISMKSGRELVIPTPSIGEANRILSLLGAADGATLPTSEGA